MLLDIVYGREKVTICDVICVRGLFLVPTQASRNRNGLGVWVLVWYVALKNADLNVYECV